MRLRGDGADETLRRDGADGTLEEMEPMGLNETLNRGMDVEQPIALNNSTHSGFMSLHDTTHDANETTP